MSLNVYISHILCEETVILFFKAKLITCLIVWYQFDVRPYQYQFNLYDFYCEEAMQFKPFLVILISFFVIPCYHQYHDDKKSLVIFYLSNHFLLFIHEVTVIFTFSSHICYLLFPLFHVVGPNQFNFIIP